MKNKVELINLNELDPNKADDRHLAGYAAFSQAVTDSNAGDSIPLIATLKSSSWSKHFTAEDLEDISSIVIAMTTVSNSSGCAIRKLTRNNELIFEKIAEPTFSFQIANQQNH